jgi:hypothetical protein
MKYDFATVQLGGFTAPGLPLARWIELFQLRILGLTVAKKRALHAAPLELINVPPWNTT